MTASERLRGRGFALAAAIACAASTVHRETESDTFWHLTLGRAVLAAGARVVPEPVALRAFTRPDVVPEWLWDVTTYALFRAGSWPALSALVACLAFATALLAARYVADAAPDAGPGARAAVTGIGIAAAMARMRIRPEAAATPLLLLFLIVCMGFARAETSRVRWRRGAAAVALAVAWAQIHGSFVLAPALFAITAAPAVVASGDRRARTEALAVFGGLVLALTTSAYGVGLVGYILAHASGDATRHVADMIPPSFAVLSPANALTAPIGPSFLALIVIGLAGMVATRRVWVRDVALAGLGVALAYDANRFLATAPLLAAPLAVRGVDALRDLFGAGGDRPRWRRASPWVVGSPGTELEFAL